MPASLQINGLDELLTPERVRELRDDTAPLVEAAAVEAEAAIRAAYPKHTGNLKDGLRHRIETTAYRTRARLENIAPHAAIYEFGTEIRHTDLGQNRGRMPAGKIFIPTAIRERRDMKADVIEIVERAGFTVHGS
jgi:hypothetical protein